MKSEFFDVTVNGFQLGGVSASAQQLTMHRIRKWVRLGTNWVRVNLLSVEINLTLTLSVDGEG